MDNSLNNEFGGYVTRDTAPRNSICAAEDCEKPAAHLYLVTAGIFHGHNKLCCDSCGEEYASYIERTSKEAKVRAELTSARLHNLGTYRVHDSPLSEQGTWKVVRSQERYEEEISTLKDDEVCQIPERHDGEIENWKDYNGWVSPTFPQ